MKEVLKKIGLSTSIIALLAFGVIGSPTTTTSAADPKDLVCSGVGKTGLDGCSPDGTNIDTVWTFAGTITTWILIAVGIVCVLFIIFGGIKFATSGGDPEKVKSAKNTVLYAVIGLTIALFATLIVNIVVSMSSQAANTKSAVSCPAGHTWDTGVKDTDGKYGKCVKQTNNPPPDGCPTDKPTWDPDLLANNAFGACKK